MAVRLGRNRIGMGDSMLELVTTGGHGCNRDAKVGEEVRGCGKMGCPDCEALRAVEVFLRVAGAGTLKSARFVHWPGQPDEVVDVIDVVNADGEVMPYASLKYASAAYRLRVTRRKRDFQGNTE